MFVTDIDCCYASDGTFGESGYKGVYTYNTTLIGETVQQTCRYNPSAVFQRKCEENSDGIATWKKVTQLSKCEYFKEKTKNLEKLAELVKKVNQVSKSKFHRGIKFLVVTYYCVGCKVMKPVYYGSFVSLVSIVVQSITLKNKDIKF